MPQPPHNPSPQDSPPSEAEAFAPEPGAEDVEVDELSLAEELEDLLAEIEEIEPGIVPSKGNPGAPTATTAEPEPQGEPAPEGESQPSSQTEATTDAEADPEGEPNQPPQNQPDVPADVLAESETDPDPDADTDATDHEAASLPDAHQAAFDGDAEPAEALDAPQAPQEATPAPAAAAGPTSDADLAAAINAALSQAETGKGTDRPRAADAPAARPSKPAAATATPSMSPDDASQSEADAARTPPEPQASNSIDDLDKQIEGLLQEANAMGEAVAGTTPEPDEAAPDDAAASTLDADTPASQAPAPPVSAFDDNSLPPTAPEPEAAADISPTSDEEPPTGEQQALRELDDMLAQSGDADDLDDMAGAFETVDEVLVADTSSEGDPDDVESEAPTDDLAQLLDKDSDAVPPVEAAGRPPGSAADAGASAADVAAELDDQPETGGASGPAARDRDDQGRGHEAADDDSPTASETASEPKKTWPARLRGAVIRVEPIARVACFHVNRPLDLLPREYRSTVGYVGLLTLANGGFLLLYHLLT